MSAGLDTLSSGWVGRTGTAARVPDPEPPTEAEALYARILEALGPVVDAVGVKVAAAEFRIRPDSLRHAMRQHAGHSLRGESLLWLLTRTVADLPKGSSPQDIKALAAADALRLVAARAGFALVPLAEPVAEEIAAVEAINAALPDWLAEATFRAAGLKRPPRRQEPK